MTVAYVEWIDSGVAATGWDTFAGVHHEARQMAETPIASAGLLLNQDDTGITLALSVNQRAEEACLAMFIPRPLIRAMSVWEPATPAASDGSLDVERLARALDAVADRMRYMPESFVDDRDWASELAAEYARLSESASEGKTE